MITATGSRAAVLLTLCAGMFLVQLDVTVVNVAVPAIGTDLGAGLPAQQWVVDGYAVVLASLLLAGGALGDVLGHRGVVVAGFGFFGAASAACALAGSAGWLVAGRMAQGLGAALLLPGTLALLTDAYPERREQARAVGIWAGVSALALSAGPLLGGFIVTAAGWRTVFWLNVPLVALAILATLLLIPPGRRATHRHVDVLGAVTAAVALGAFVFAVIEGSLAGLVAGCAATAAFVVVEWRAADPMLPLGLLRSRRFSGANLVSGAMNFVGLGCIFVLTLYLQRVLGLSPLGAAVRVLPLFLPLTLLAPVTGRLTARFGPRPLIVAGLALGAAGAANLLRVSQDSGYAVLVPTFLGFGTGMGLLTAAVVSAAVGGVPPERAGIASGVNNTARQAAGALGVAAFGALAGEPARREEFVAGLHVVGVVSAVLWVAAIGVAGWTLRDAR